MSKSGWGRRAARGLLLAVLILSTSVLYGAFDSQDETGDVAAVHIHVGNAYAAAKLDLRPYLAVCRKKKPTLERILSKFRVARKLIETRLGSDPPIVPMKVFDNFYFVGTKPVSAWAIDTSEGIILIDTLSHDDDARALEAALKDLGLDPARIKYMIIAHGSGDHYGGARYFQEKYGARVVMTDVEWTWIEHRWFDANRWVWGRGRPPDRDIAVADGDKLQLGDTVLELYLTPGHTPGSLAAIFSVTDGGQPHRVLFTGGTSFDIESKASTLQKFVLSMEGLREAVRREHVDIHITSNGRYDGVLEKVAALKQRQPGQSNPFVIGEETVARSLTVMDECARASIAALAPDQMPPSAASN